MVIASVIHSTGTQKNPFTKKCCHCTASSDVETLQTIRNFSNLIFLAEAVRLEADGFNLVIDIKMLQTKDLRTIALDFHYGGQTDNFELTFYGDPIDVANESKKSLCRSLFT